MTVNKDNNEDPNGKDNSKDNNNLIFDTTTNLWLDEILAGRGVEERLLLVKGTN